MHLPANFFFSMNHFFNCQRIFGSQSIIKCLQQVVGISKLRAAGDAFIDYLLLRQIVFVVPIVMRMNLVECLVLLEIQFPGCFKQLVFSASLFEFLHDLHAQRVEGARKHLYHVKAINHKLSVGKACSYNVLIVKIQVQRNCFAAGENFLQ